MDNLKLFLSACMPIRILIIILAYIIGNKFQTFIPVTILLSILVAMGFLYNDLIKKQKGFFGNKRYWSGTIHSIFFLLFALIMYIKPKYSYLILLIDLIYGITTVMKFYNK